MGDPTTFDFPASTTFRDQFNHSEKRRPTLPPLGRHSDEQEMLDYILFLEGENRQLRAALDIARTTSNVTRVKHLPETQHYEGLDHE
jgi:hypothetical protein